MNYVWIGERVSVVDVEQLLRNVLIEKPEIAWGPNSTFRYPLRGGTGFLYERCARFVEHKLELNTPVVAVDPGEKVVTTADGRRWPYDVLLSTMPLNHLVERTQGTCRTRSAGRRGLHLERQPHRRRRRGPPGGHHKNWIYFPEPDVPFYRVTYLSNYSPYMTRRARPVRCCSPRRRRSTYKLEDPETIVDRVVDGLVTTGLLGTGRTGPDRGARGGARHGMSYPVPSVGRDAALGTIQPWLRSQQISVPRAVRRLALRDRQHGPLGDAGRRVGGPRPVGRAGGDLDPAGRGRRRRGDPVGGAASAPCPNALALFGGS